VRGKAFERFPLRRGGGGKGRRRKSVCGFSSSGGIKKVQGWAGVLSKKAKIWFETEAGKGR